MSLFLTIARWWRLRVWATIAFTIWLIILAAEPARSQGTSATVPAAPEPIAAAVNTKTNRIYVLHEDTSTVSVIDGPTNTVTTITDPGGTPRAVAAEPVSNKIYLVNRNNVAVVDGATNSSTSVTDPNALHPVAVDLNPKPATGMRPSRLPPRFPRTDGVEWKSGQLSRLAICGGELGAANCRFHTWSFDIGVASQVQ